MEVTQMIIRTTLGALGFLIALALGLGLASLVLTKDPAVAHAQIDTGRRVAIPASFDLEVLVDGRPASEYFARGRTYVEAIRGAEYELRIRNPSSYRVAVALSVDGLNTIDAKHTSAHNASKWVIEPYQSITISGWQMSTERARRFYFTNESDSYGAKLGQTANLGVISAVIFRERRREVTVVPPRPIYREDSKQKGGRDLPAKSSEPGSAEASANSRMAQPSVDEYPATGIGRSVRNDVRWVNMELESHPAAEMSIRYEYHSTLLRLGVIPRPIREPFPLGRREDSRGFSPEPKN
jgi:hypothetical protein